MAPLALREVDHGGLVMPETRTPQPGDPLRLDGFLYQLAGTRKRLADGDRVVLLQEFTRPDAPDPVLAAVWRANFHYKKSGLCLQSELVWTDPASWREELNVQAAQLARGKPAARAWARTAVEALVDAYAEAPACWTLPGRHLLLPLPDRPLPEDPAEALRLARAVLDGSYYAPVEG